uniref:Uncharacterized protein n=1 Tax=Arundo donax TaxID=35708 RepID=A0A0A9B4W9_ARUDO
MKETLNSGNSNRLTLACQNQMELERDILNNNTVASNYKQTINIHTKQFDFSRNGALGLGMKNLMETNVSENIYR